MRILISMMAFSVFLLTSSCCSDATKESDTGSAEQSTPAASRPAVNRY